MSHNQSDAENSGAGSLTGGPSNDEGFPVNPPHPFQPSVRRGPFTTHNGPWYHWADAQQFRQGLRLQQRHCNGRGIAHGGFISAFADGLTATAIFRELRRGSVTMKLNTEFLRSANAGDWLQGTAKLTRATRNMAFVEAYGWTGEAQEIAHNDLVFFASAVFRLLEEH